MAMRQFAQLCQEVERLLANGRQRGVRRLCRLCCLCCLCCRYNRRRLCHLRSLGQVCRCDSLYRLRDLCGIDSCHASVT